MLGKGTIEYELERAQKMMHDPTLGDEHRAMLFGYQEGLAWILGRGGSRVADLVYRERRPTQVVPRV